MYVSYKSVVSHQSQVLQLENIILFQLGSTTSKCLLGCGDGGGESGEGGAVSASASPRVEEPPPVPPAAAPAAPNAPADQSPTADSWEAEADDALLTPDDNNEPDEEELDQQVQILSQFPFYTKIIITDFYFFISTS